MDRWLIEALTGVSPGWLYVVVGVLVTAESVLFGLVLPGELVLLLAGFLAYHQKVSLVIMLIVTGGSAVGGYLLGYEVGRRFGSRLRTCGIGRRIGERRWRRVDTALATKGGRAILIGRLVGLLRAIMPVGAGMSRMPYNTFLAYSAVGGLVWAPGFVLIGHTVGSSYQKIAQVVGPASLGLLAAGIVIPAGVVIVRRYARRDSHRGSEGD